MGQERKAPAGVSAHEEPSDEALMRAYIAGDKAAFRALFERYSAVIFRAMRAGGLTEDVARDLMQQAFLQFHRARNDFRLDARLRPWLLTIAYNLKRDYLRGRKRRVELPLEPELHAGTAAGPDRDLAQVRDVARVRRAVAALPDGYREVVELHWFSELPFPEVAGILGIKLNAAKVRAHRAYKKLREILQRENAATANAAARKGA
jgi:RNA polymerase sigma factor (sigma-70 family)